MAGEQVGGQDGARGASGAAPEAKRSSRWPSWLGGVTTVVLSVVAIVVSVVAYLDQHTANQSAAVAQQQTYASKLTFWLTDDATGTVLNVQNSSTDPDADVEIVVNQYVRGATPTHGYAALGTLPPCTIGSWYLSTDIDFDIQTLGGGGVSGAWGTSSPSTPPGGVDPGSGAFAGIEFTDANATTWQRLTNGKLQQVDSGYAIEALSDPARLTKQVPAPTCS